MELIFLTSSKAKLKEMERVLGKGYYLYSTQVVFPEIASIDVEEVVRQKVKHAYEIVKKPVFMESTGLYIKLCAGKYFPGALTNFYVNYLGLKCISKMHKGCDAHAITSIAYHDGKKIHIFSGKINGKISVSPRGTKGFGWDSIFIPNNKKYNSKKLTFGQLTEKIKDQMSMRKTAVMKFKRFLAK